MNAINEVENAKGTGRTWEKQVVWDLGPEKDSSQNFRETRQERTERGRIKLQKCI